MRDFNVECTFERIGLTMEQVEEHGLDRLSIEVKPSDSRSAAYIAEYGDRCWEADILPADVIERAINVEVMSCAGSRTPA